MGRGWAPSAVGLRWRCMQLAETECLYLYLGFRSGGIWPSGRALVCPEAGVCSRWDCRGPARHARRAVEASTARPSGCRDLLTLLQGRSGLGEHGEALK